MNKKDCGKSLLSKLQPVSVDDFPLRDWNAAKSYLSQGPPVNS